MRGRGTFWASVFIALLLGSEATNVATVVNQAREAQVGVDQVTAVAANDSATFAKILQAIRDRMEIARNQVIRIRDGDKSFLRIPIVSDMGREVLDAGAVGETVRQKLLESSHAVKGVSMGYVYALLSAIFAIILSIIIFFQERSNAKDGYGEKVKSGPKTWYQKLFTVKNLLFIFSLIMGILGLLYLFIEERQAMIDSNAEALVRNDEVLRHAATLSVIRIIPDVQTDVNVNGNPTMISVISFFFVLFVASAFSGARNSEKVDARKLAEFMKLLRVANVEGDCKVTPETIKNEMIALDRQIKNLMPGNNFETEDRFRLRGSKLRWSTIVVLVVILVLMGVYCAVAFAALAKYTSSDKGLGVNASEAFRDPGFWLESFIFAFLLTVPRALHEFRRSPWMILVTFLVSMFIQIFFEISGFFRWAFPRYPGESLLCPELASADVRSLPGPGPLTIQTTATKAVNVSECVLSEEMKRFLAEPAYNAHGLAFAAVAVALIMLLGPVKFIVDKIDSGSIREEAAQKRKFLSHASAHDETFSDELFFAIVTALMAFIASEYMSIRRTNKPMSVTAGLMITAKFAFHHLLWKYLGINHVLAELSTRIFLRQSTGLMGSVETVHAMCAKCDKPEMATFYPCDKCIMWRICDSPGKCHTPEEIVAPTDPDKGFVHSSLLRALAAEIEVYGAHMPLDARKKPPSPKVSSSHQAKTGEAEEEDSLE